MMDSKTAERLADLSDNFLKFLDLHPDEQDWLFPLLGPAEKRVILTLWALQGGFVTYKQIAEKTNCHPSTVKTTLYALQDKGIINLSQDKTGRWATPRGGRYRALKRLEDKQ